MVIGNVLYVPEPLTSFVYTETIDYADKIRVLVRSARGTRVTAFVLSYPVDHGKFLTECYETYTRLSQEEKAVEDLLR